MKSVEREAPKECPPYETVPAPLLRPPWRRPVAPCSSGTPQPIASPTSASVFSKIGGQALDLEDAFLPEQEIKTHNEVSYFSKGITNKKKTINKTAKMYDIKMSV